MGFPAIFVGQSQVVNLVGLQKDEDHLQIRSADCKVQQCLLAIPALEIEVKSFLRILIVVDRKLYSSKIAHRDCDHKRC